MYTADFREIIHVCTYAAVNVLTKKNQIHGGMVGFAAEDEKIQTDLIDYFIHCNQFKCHRQTKPFFEQFLKPFQGVEKDRKLLINNKWGWNWWGCPSFLQVS